MPDPDSLPEDWFHVRTAPIHRWYAQRYRRLHALLLEAHAHLRILTSHRPPAATSEPTMYLRPLIGFGAVLLLCVTALIFIPNGLGRKVFGQDFYTTPTTTAPLTISPAPAPAAASDEVVTKAWLAPKLDAMKEQIDGVPARTKGYTRQALTADRMAEDKTDEDCGKILKSINLAAPNGLTAWRLRAADAMVKYGGDEAGSIWSGCVPRFKKWGAWRDGNLQPPDNTPVDPPVTVIRQQPIYILPPRRRPRRPLAQSGLPTDFAVVASQPLARAY